MYTIKTLNTISPVGLATSSMSRWMPTPRTVFWCAAPTF